MPCCPQCMHSEAYFITRRKHFQCKKCRRQTSVTAGTVFQKLRQPLQKLFWAVYLISTTKKGISALELQRKLGIKSYRTAWLLLHKIRKSMNSSNNILLSSDVQVDETYIGGSKEGPRGRGAKGKALVAAAVETDGTNIGKASLRLINRPSKNELCQFVKDHVKPGVTVTTDGFKSYQSLEKEYLHNPKIAANQKNTTDLLPKVHIIIANLKMWLRGIFNRYPTRNFQSYLDEFIFRFNRRWNIKEIFDILLTQCLKNSHITFAELMT